MASIKEDFEALTKKLDQINRHIKLAESRMSGCEMEFTFSAEFEHRLGWFKHGKRWRIVYWVSDSGFLNRIPLSETSAATRVLMVGYLETFCDAVHQKIRDLLKE